ncbi:GNAT family N-acetyltransferase [Streptomyces albidoflavus]|uniref:GNAT family N-acetyltransferase n=1 Tax=Streptomyces albidoflavus TaxID=1886 RepID=UPI002F914C5F|nr:GNAT family N-acetyltransferase [Streptomyces albidoflavus]WTD45981.1 GNAT family N-acetyltransferase [Streptomyces albidoflavus]WTD86129.1 GNAT family N-acetyltransferase [Streptomyces albidoflavus]
MRPLCIRQASLADASDLMALRIEAEGWLARAGVDQWRDPATRPTALAKWRADIEHGRTWVVDQPPSGRLVGTVTLANADRDFWHPEDDLDNALYVAKLITSRAARGANLGARLLDWVGQQARQSDRAWIRLDCWRTNAALQAYYVHQGFEHVRTEAPDHRKSGWLAQRSSLVAAHPEAPLTPCEASRERSPAPLEAA